MNADIQAMNDGEVKTTAMKEIGMAEAMMGLKDMKACVTHMYNAMDAMDPSQIRHLQYGGFVCSRRLSALASRVTGWTGRDVA